ncbi:hypothetical protein EON65_53805 [archaeon]|nr:MAG: hypothetical protein EON65_53805 [archaeon]
MKTFIILFFLTFTTTVALANQDFTWVQRFKNIVAEQGSLTHTTSLCGRDKFYMFLTLLTKMSKEVCNDSIYVHVIFGDDKIRNLDGSNTSAQYALGYCYNDFILPPEEIPPLKPYIINRYAINLVCRYGDPNISDCLALINYAFTHKEEISLNQGIVLSANFHERKLVPSISAKTIDSILAHKHEAVKSFIACKTGSCPLSQRREVGSSGRTHCHSSVLRAAVERKQASASSTSHSRAKASLTAKRINFYPCDIH